MEQKYEKCDMKKVWFMLMALQLVQRQLNRKEFKYIGQQIEKARLELIRIQDQLYSQSNDESIDQEKEILLKLEKWSMIEENALRQKSRTKNGSNWGVQTISILVQLYRS